jgi:hypothetical protein
LEAAMLVLLMGRMASDVMIYVTSLIKIDYGILVMLRFTQTISEVVVTVCYSGLVRAFW